MNQLVQSFVIIINQLCPYCLEGTSIENRCFVANGAYFSQKRIFGTCRETLGSRNRPKQLNYVCWGDARNFIAGISSSNIGTDSLNILKVLNRLCRYDHLGPPQSFHFPRLHPSRGITPNSHFGRKNDENTAFSLKRFLPDVLIVREKTPCAVRDSSKFLMAANQVYEITLACWWIEVVLGVVAWGAWQFFHPSANEVPGSGLQLWVAGHASEIDDVV